MDRRERERILGEHAPREQTPLEERLVGRLAEDLEGSPLVGKPLPRRLRNFSLAADRYAVALAGPPAYARRLREIEDETAAHEEALARPGGARAPARGATRARSPGAGAASPSAGASTP